MMQRIEEENTIFVYKKFFVCYYGYNICKQWHDKFINSLEYKTACLNNNIFMNCDFFN